MTFSAENTDQESAGSVLTALRTPAVRHLAWMCSAAQLLGGPAAIDLGRLLPTDWLERLRFWDAQPQAAPQSLKQPVNPRLGLYFESLYACLMTDLLGWQLLARNLPIRRAGITLGELDFVLRNPLSGAVEHHEIAIKFYLGYPPSGTADTAPLWYGPNAHDRLDLKRQRLVEQQSQRSELADTRAALATLGIEPPQAQRIFMPGYLFYPSDQSLAPPPQTPSQHARGSWLYLDAVARCDTAQWVALRKPHWIGPWVQSAAPDSQATQAALAQVHNSGTPRLFARLQRAASGAGWYEVQRMFVVPAHWPGV